MVFIIDVETTGLKGIPKDRVLEVGICELDEKTGTIVPFYDSVIRYPDIEEFHRDYRYIDPYSGEEKEGCWIFNTGNMDISEVLHAEKDLRTVVYEVRRVVEGKKVTSYNVPYDFGQFLECEPWNLSDCTVKGDDIMVLASQRIREMFEAGETPEKFHSYLAKKDWENEELHTRSVAATVAYEILCPDNPMSLDRQSHRALNDAVMEAHILKKLI